MAANVDDPPIGGHFEVHAGRPLDGAGGGLDTYAVSDRRGGGEPLMAVRVPDGQGPRAQTLSALAKGTVPFCLVPRAHGVGRDRHGRAAQFVICPAPPGPSLEGTNEPPWSEPELLETVLRPVAAALAALQARHVTHRAIRADNLFQSARGQPVTLGCAWACAPASRQPAVYEPPYAAVCSPGGVDEGVIADDVYALGVLLVALASGAQPLAGLDAQAVVACKLSLGSAAAIIGETRLPPIVADLARGMLADDPEHRPSPALLADPEMARARRVAARPRRRAQRSIEVGAQTAWDARGLAHALAGEPAQAIRVLREGGVDRWLRRGLGDPSLALFLEEAVRQRAAETILDETAADATLLMRAVAILDPLAPLCWRGLRLWPGALGAALAIAPAAEEAVLAQMIDAEAIAAWALARAQRADPVRAQVEARQLRSTVRQRGWAGGIARLRYISNPLLPCRSALLQGGVVVRAVDLLPALERAGDSSSRPTLPMDAELAAFAASRAEFRMDAEFVAMGQIGAPQDAAIAQLRVLARLQAKAPSLALPGLASWLAVSCVPAIAAVRGRSRRAAGLAAFEQQVAAGRLGGMLAMFDDPALAEADQRELEVAEAALAELDAAVAAAERRLRVGRLGSRRLGREIAAAVGVLAMAASAVLAAL